MKRISVFILAAVLALCGLAGCKKTAAAPFAGLTTEQIVEKIYAALPKDTELPAFGSTPITAENVSYYAGTSEISFKEGTASEPLINAIAYSLCVFRLNDPADSGKVQEAIRANVNPNKWICVGVDESNVIVDGAGDVVVLIMAEGAEAIHDAFKKLAEE